MFDLIPARARRVIYIVLGVAVPLEAVWDFLPSVLEGKLIATLAALGFGMAAGNAKDTTDNPPIDNEGA